MRRPEALEKLALLLPSAKTQFGVETLSIFGSVARDEATDASDIDVLVDFDGPATFDRFMGLKLYLEDALGVPVDLATRRALKPQMRPRIEAEALRVA
jgi:predicted nucleotidyltransferase